MFRRLHACPLLTGDLPACLLSCQVIAINTADPKAAAVNSLEDVER
jgi:hypothetical protein